MTETMWSLFWTSALESLRQNPSDPQSAAAPVLAALEEQPFKRLCPANLENPSPFEKHSKTKSSNPVSVFQWLGNKEPKNAVAHDCGCPLSRYTCRATRVAGDVLDFRAFCRCSTGVALHPLKFLVSHLPPPAPEVSHRNLGLKRCRATRGCRSCSCGCRATLGNKEPKNDPGRIVRGGVFLLAVGVSISGACPRPPDPST